MRPQVSLMRSTLDTLTMHKPMGALFLLDPLYLGNSGGALAQRGGRIALAVYRHGGVT
jgi:hypothetical protein